MTKEEIKNYLQRYPGLDSTEIEEIAEYLVGQNEDNYLYCDVCGIKPPAEHNV